jgi:hypothetical protein
VATSPARHRWFPAEARRKVVFILCLQARLTRQHLLLPNELWCLIISILLGSSTWAQRHAALF